MADPTEEELEHADDLEAEAHPHQVLQHYEVLRRRYPRSALVHVRIAGVLAYERDGKGRSALDHYQAALELQEAGEPLGEFEEWLARVGIGMLRLQPGRARDFGQAIVALERAVARWPTDKESRFYLACARCARGDVDGALRELARVLADEPPPPFLADDTASIEEYRARIADEILLAPARRHPAYPRAQ